MVIFHYRNMDNTTTKIPQDILNIKVFTKGNQKQPENQQLQDEGKYFKFIQSAEEVREKTAKKKTH